MYNPPQIIVPLIRLLLACFMFGACMSDSVWASDSPGLTLTRTLELAIKHDAWLTSSTATQRGLQAQSQAVDRLPNPRLSLHSMNLPTDTLSFNQENFTQLSLGISQMFPRGNSRALRSQQLTQQGQALPLQRLDRIKQISATVTQLWLDIYEIDQSVLLIHRNQALFEQLVDISRANYASTFGRTRQQDIIGAQLELTRLRERLSRLRQERAVVAARLAGWVYPDQSMHAMHAQVITLNLVDETLALTHAQNLLIDKVTNLSDAAMAEMLFRHPMIASVDQSIVVLETAEALSKQQYAPEWGVSAAYSYRDDSPTGQPRSDFISFGVSLELPLLQRHQTDAAVAASGFEVDAMRAERLLKLRQMRAALSTELAQLSGLKTRLALYEQDLLPQMRSYAEATLSAYSHDESDFAEVVRARINLLDAKIEVLGLQTRQQTTFAKLSYFLPTETQLAMPASLALDIPADSDPADSDPADSDNAKEMEHQHDRH
jgi:outer membrane protein TolC